MRTTICLAGALFLLVPGSAAQDAIYKYWVQFSDKDGSPFSLERPEEFLSQRSIDRRQRQNIPFDWKDLPVNPFYADRIGNDSINVLYTSKWLNGAVVETRFSGQEPVLLSHPFVTGVQLLFGSSCQQKSGQAKFGPVYTANESGFSSDHQIKMLEGHQLHASGYIGSDMIIAQLDTGFEGADSIEGLTSLFLNGQILATRNFVEPGTGIYSLGYHGTHVLSIMGGYLPGRYSGCAPGASYLLIQTEDTRHEFHIEEANWLAGAEFADSAGADIINSSLGYSDGFTCPADNYGYFEMDGRTALVTKAADIAASRGILVVNSAGNAGSSGDPWQFVTAPADGDSVLSVGAIDSLEQDAAFSSMGPTYDGRIKPDVVAQGVATAVITSSGMIAKGNGTSYSAPIIAGLAACLWEMYPEATNHEIARAIRMSGQFYPYFTNKQGYGKPNFMIAAGILRSYNGIEGESQRSWIWPNPAEERLYISLPDSRQPPLSYQILDMLGRILVSGDPDPDSNPIVVPLENLPSGSYVIIVSGDDHVYKNIFTKL